MTRPERTRLVSGRAATTLLADSDCCEPVQARHVLAAGLAGLGFDYGSAVIYEHDKVIELTRRPRLTEAGLWSQLPMRTCIVARQHARSLTAPDNDQTRPWYGVDSLAPDSEQRLASSRWWELSSKRRDLIEDTARQSELPLLVSVGGYIVRGYSVEGIDYDLSRRFNNGKWALSLSPQRPEWAPDVENRWMRTPRGPALIILENPGS